MLENGQRRKMSDLEVGDSVLTVDDFGRQIFSPIILNLHRDPKERAEFLVIQTDTGHSLTLTQNHLIYTKHQRDEDEQVGLAQNDKIGNKTNGPEKTGLEYMNSFHPDFAGNVKNGDLLLVYNGVNGLETSKIVNVGKTIETGVYSPLTDQGNILAEGVLASCYSDFDSHQMQHVAWTPFRWWNQITTFSPSMKTKLEDYFSNSEDAGSTHWYGQGLHSFSRRILPWKTK